MATSMAALSRRLSRALISNSKPKPTHLNPLVSAPFSTTTTIDDSDLEGPDSFLSDSESVSSQSSPSNKSNQKRAFQDPVLENGVDAGVYKAVIVGRVGQKPVQKQLKNGLTLTMLSVGTGGIRNNRRPLENESPREYAERSAIQWHRVCVYPERLGAIVMKNAVPGSILYLDGNLETKIFTDPISGIVRRIREISIRQNGRVVFLGEAQAGDGRVPTQAELRGLVY
ncbi:Single-stranded DNA-binding protein [Morus notabilis]|uniref:Single-stranded DNA-binding protein n=1 Tax=Morus notabilis TaxID=981085 RepID=W9SGS7_9ROSA|nr:uncharacterized protein LOC21405102 [Morus notabilis]EXC28049.1 Single-stranded DNA-binding protein [Morus notabilis]